MAKAQQATISIDALKELHEQLSGLDAQIAAAGGNEAAARKAVLEQLVSENQDSVDKVLTQLRGILDGAEPALLAGLTERINTTLTEVYKPKIDEYVKGQVEERTKGNKDNVTALKESRKALVERDKALRTILTTFDIDVSEVPEPKRGGGRPAGSGGGSGKSGRNRENYRFSIDGKARPDSQNSLSSVTFYATAGCPKALGKSEDEKMKWGTQELKDFLAEQGVKYGEDDTWEVTLPNGKKVGAVREAAPAEGETQTEAQAEPEKASA